MTPFVHQTRARRVVFGAGCFGQLADELRALGGGRALVLTTPGQRRLGDAAAERLGTACAGRFDRAAMHVPAEVVDDAVAEARRRGADALVAIGGGSTTGLAKAIALRLDLPILAVPTTFAGSEMTSVHGITEGGRKTTGRDDRVAPRTVVYDPDLVAALPPRVAVASGFNAIAHAAEGLYAFDGNPLTSRLAEDGIRALAQAMPRFAAEGLSPELAAAGLYGACLCGMVLDGTAMGLHHKLCHTLGGSFDLPHAETHAVMLPHTLAYNAWHAAGPMRRLARALDADDGPLALHRLLRSTGGPASLAELGLPEDRLDAVVGLALAGAYPNPRPLEATALRAMLQDAFEGVPPPSTPH